MGRYTFAEHFALTANAVEYAPGEFGRYGQEGYARNVFPEQFALQSPEHYVEQPLPEPYGSVGQPISADSATR